VTFHVLPAPPSPPLAVAGFQRGSALTFAETSSGTPAVMTLRITRLGLFDGSPTAGPDPTFWLSAGGPAAPVSPQPGKVSILNQNEAIVASAAYSVETFDVYRIDVTVQRPGSSWSLQIENNEEQQRRFTAVVADTDAGARQPWINAPATLALTGPHGSALLVPGDLLVANYGTGPLTIQPTGLSDPFLVIPPEDIAPNGSGHLTVQYDPTKAGPRQQTLTVASNDSTAGAQASHNHVVTVTYKDLTPSPPPPPPPPPPGPQFGPCQLGCGCTGYLNRAHPGGNCQQPMCGHPAFDHL